MIGSDCLTKNTTVGDKDVRSAVITAGGDDRYLHSKVDDSKLLRHRN